MRRLCAVALLLWLAPVPAFAHLVSTRFGELYTGVLHPLTTLAHLVPWLAVGLLAGLQSPRTGRWSIVAFPIAVIAGVAAAGTVSLPFIELVNGLSFIVLGALVAAAVPLPPWLFLSLVTLFGLSHGYANSAPDIRDFQSVLYASGVGLTAYVLVTLTAGSAQALATAQPWGSIAVRAAGSWIAAAGTMYAGFLLLAG
ncbi:MAG: HupE/UreJ family protein [Pseudomonadota bacterium]